MYVNNNFEREEDMYVLEKNMTAFSIFGFVDPFAEGTGDAVR